MHHSRFSLANIFWGGLTESPIPHSIFPGVFGTPVCHLLENIVSGLQLKTLRHHSHTINFLLLSE